MKLWPVLGYSKSELTQVDRYNWICWKSKMAFTHPLCSHVIMENSRVKAGNWKMIAKPGPVGTAGYFLMIFTSHYSCVLMMCQIWKAAVCLLGALNTDMMTLRGCKRENGRLLTLITSTDTISYPSASITILNHNAAVQNVLKKLDHEQKRSSDF